MSNQPVSASHYNSSDDNKTTRYIIITKIKPFTENTSSSGGESFEGYGENENTESGVELDLPTADSMNNTVIGLVG